MKIRALKLHIVSADGDFGFSFAFGRRLTIIRGRNSAGKSTFFNTLLYALGMEELVGGRDPKVLPYGVRDYFSWNGRDLLVIASEALVEIENDQGKVVTFRRAIKHEHRQPKLIEIFDGELLTGNAAASEPKPTYIHDSGAAVRTEGFHRYFEQFLGLELPTVPTSSGGETKLYLQTIFAAVAVEQKRGWTDYIATIPFYGIREARTKVVEFLLGLSVFEADSLRNRLNAESVRIHEEWLKQVHDIQRSCNDEGLLVQGVAARPDVLFQAELVRIVKLNGSLETPLAEYRSQLRQEYRELEARADTFNSTSGEKAVADLDAASEQIRELSFHYAQSTTELTLQRASLTEYEAILTETNEDLARNVAAQKLKTLGTDFAPDLSADRCPTCHQSISDSLLGEAISGPVMDLDENISYLKSQRQMLERQIRGVKETIGRLEGTSGDLSRRLAAKRDHLISLRGDMSSGAVQSRAILRRQLQIEGEVERLASVESDLPNQLGVLTDLAKKLAENQGARKNLPKDRYSDIDGLTLSIFQKQFRANAGSFGYESADIAAIDINHDTLTPVLEKLELRQISKKEAAGGTDIKADSSASDFVRLIWSYLLALYQTSTTPGVDGNHLGILLLDEPGQHSMRVESQHALLQQLAGETELQSIVAASFDESESVFREATADVTFTLIEWEDKLIRPLTKSENDPKGR